MTSILIEAESFSDLGGWVVDTQSIRTIGSAYLLAHGLGVPVGDARTTVTLPHGGLWRLWVRTRDWAPPHGPGAFTVSIDGIAQSRLFGLGGDGAWAWHDGGTVAIGAGPTTVALHDLTGFDGRCDCLLLSDGAEPPPASGQELEALRRHGQPAQAEDLGSFDLVVAGGGYAGICAAVTAARHGLRCALIHDRQVLGGMASSEVRVGPIGDLDLPPYPRNADVVRDLDAGISSSGGQRSADNDQQVLELVRREPNLTCLTQTHLHAVEQAGGRIIAVRVRHLRTGRESRLAGVLFADCTGDADLGVLAGAEWRSGRESRSETGEAMAPEHPDHQVLGNTNFWRAVRSSAPSSFPACPWALPIASDTDWEVAPPKWPVKLGELAFAGGWNWESGFSRDAAVEAEAIRDHNLRAIFGTWDWLKNRSPRRQELVEAKLSWVGHVLGKRESRRLIGDHLLTQMDLEDGRMYGDGCVTATWYFDLHFPHPDNTARFPGQEFRSMAYDDPDFERFRGATPGSYTRIKPYPIPYRCLYSRTIANLFMAGRNISVTHVALAPVRTQKTTGMMGTVVGRAALLCRRLGVDPRAIYSDHLDEFKRLLAKPDAPIAKHQDSRS
ncbi:MAG: FAD-dependent oxidoreductase [Planctomycetota bacterium]|jgi:hypothetical protein|nr:FAD-dependent oxidoreductase [Planctomycetota bacterium]